MSDILQVEHLKRYFIKKSLFSSKKSVVKAADDVSFTLKEGEVFVLAGESGSGKSTIARLILKAIEADSGKIIFDGDVIGDHSASLEKIRMQCQMVQQDPKDSINPRMKVFDIISEPLQIHKVGSKLKSTTKSLMYYAR